MRSQVVWRESNLALFNSCSTLEPTPTRKPMINQTQLASEYQIGGDHYRNKSVQPWTAMEAWMTPEEFEGFLRGNVIKYIARYKDKEGLKDVYKAKHYLERLVEHLESGTGKGQTSGS